MNDSIGKGYIHVYTGEGKGKTTAALGLAVRALGSGHRVLMIQFLKGDDMTGERRAAEKFGTRFQIRPRGRNGLLHPGDIGEEDRVQTMEALIESCREITSNVWDLVVLDEIITACALNLLPVERVLELMDSKPDGMELVLTGRGAPDRVVEKADLVTEMREVKHYFRQGVPAREGIEK